jgi:transposase
MRHYRVFASAHERAPRRKHLRKAKVSDAFWQRVEPLVPERPGRPSKKKFQRRPGGGRKPKDARTVFEAIVYVLRTGCQWKALPKERFGSGSAVHKRFLEWERAGFFCALWQMGLAECDDMAGIAWRWRGMVLRNAPPGQESVEPNPTNRRSKKGTQADGADRREWGPVVDHRDRSPPSSRGHSSSRREAGLK